MNSTSSSFDELATRAVGVHMILASTIGLFLNIIAFRHFLKLETSSFYLLCTSKCVSNCAMLLIYLTYIGPTNLLYRQVGPDFLNFYLNQAQTTTFQLLGPITQFLITINRFLVVWFSPTSIPSYSNPVTVVVLVVMWIAGLWLSTLIGLPADCLATFEFDHVGWTKTACSVSITYCVVYTIFLLAVTTNSMNFVIAAKLVWTAKRHTSLSSEAARKRRQASVRFFLQSCCQDWIVVLDVANNLASLLIYCHTHLCGFLETLAFDVMVYGLDGLIMYMFNKRVAPSNRSTAASRGRSSDVTMSKISTVTPVTA